MSAIVAMEGGEAAASTVHRQLRQRGERRTHVTEDAPHVTRRRRGSRRAHCGSGRNGGSSSAGPAAARSGQSHRPRRHPPLRRQSTRTLTPPWRGGAMRKVGDEPADAPPPGPKAAPRPPPPPTSEGRLQRQAGCSRSWCPMNALWTCSPQGR